MTPEEIYIATQNIYENRKIIDSISKQRQEEEMTLASEYKIEECNRKRLELAQKYSLLLEPIFEQNRNLENSISRNFNGGN